MIRLASLFIDIEDRRSANKVWESSRIVPPDR